jgi:hypothetical protein
MHFGERRQNIWGTARATAFGASQAHHVGRIFLKAEVNLSCA